MQCAGPINSDRGLPDRVRVYIQRRNANKHNDIGRAATRYARGPLEPNVHRCIITPSTRFIIMAATARKIKVTLNHRIDILNRNAVETFPGNQVFKAAAAILALVRVRLFFQYLACGL